MKNVPRDVSYIIATIVTYIAAMLLTLVWLTIIGPPSENHTCSQ